MILKALLKPKIGALPVLDRVTDVLGGGLALEDESGARLWGSAVAAGAERVPVRFEEVEVGCVAGPASAAHVLAALVEHLLAKEAERRALASEVLHLYREIHLIEHLSEQLTALLDLSVVGETALAQARRLIPARGGAVLLREAEGPLRQVASFGESSAIDGWAEAVADRGIAEITAHGLAAPLRGSQRTVGVLALTNEAGYSSADLKLLNTIALSTGAALENALLCDEMVSAARDREQLAGLQRELDTARTIQHSLVPRTFPPFPERSDFDVHAQMASAKAVGGDFFDFFLIDEERLGVVIGDVSGKGIPAALYMAVTRTQIKTAALQGLPPAECLAQVNRVLVEDRVGAMFATCFYGILHTVTGEFRYSNSGHNPPYLLRAGGDVELLPMTGGLPLGMFAKPRCAEAVVTLGPRDGLYLYTDGVPEATDESLEEFTSQRLRECLAGAGERTRSGLLGLVTAALNEFTGAAPQSDDVTMLAVRRQR